MAEGGEGGGPRRRVAAGGQSKLSVEEQFTVLLRDGPKEAARSSDDVPELPLWFDADKFRRGQQYFYEYFFSMFVCKLMGLLILLAIPSILHVLVRTKQSSTPIAAYKRYLSTLSHMIDWYDGDFKDPNSREFRSLREVRGKHCAAARSVNKISQLDMALTQFAFMAFQLIYPKKLGLSTNGQEDFVHFWRVMGHLIGIEDRFNVCRAEGVEETRQLCQRLLDEVFFPALRQPPQDFPAMSRALLDGMRVLSSAVDYDTFFVFIYEIFELPFTAENLSLYSRFLLSIHHFVQSYIVTSVWLATIARYIFNFLLRCSIFVARRTQLLANITLTDTVSTVRQNVCLVT